MLYYIPVGRVEGGSGFKTTVNLDKFMACMVKEVSGYVQQKYRGWHNTNSCIGRTGSYSETKVGGGEMHI